jgi:pimeloyl-ACP methyl ester carboxylesterase
MSFIASKIVNQAAPISLVEIEWQGQCLSIEHQFIEPIQTKNNDCIVFLHEGLGCVSMWRDFPTQLCNAVGMRGLVYSRPGYGQSSSMSNCANWQIDFMHIQAKEILPALLKTLDLTGLNHFQLHFFGHSDGASIAIIFASLFPELCKSLVLLAPHIMVEEITLTGISKAHQAYQSGQLLTALAKYHHQAALCFESWSSIWLSPAFTTWDLYPEVSQLQCPVLAIQGLQDQYGTMSQIEQIKVLHANTSLLQLKQCGHSPHKDQSASVIQACSRFFTK